MPSLLFKLEPLTDKEEQFIARKLSGLIKYTYQSKK
jgi:hypothetical protein